MMSSIISQLLLTLWVTNAQAANTNYDFGAKPNAVGCSLAWDTNSRVDFSYGFDIRIFQYEFEALDGYYQNYMTYEYADQTLQYSLTSVTDINFSGAIPESDKFAPYEATLFGKTFEVSNFAAEFTTYFTPLESGFYKFELDNTDNSAMVFIGAPNALECCSIVSDNNFSTVSASSYSIFTSGHNGINHLAHQYLKAHYSYPIRIIYVNMDAEYIMQLKITYPDGKIVSKFDNGDFIPPSVWSQGWVPSLCRPATVSAPSETVVTSWTGKTTSHSTFTPSTGYDVFTEYQYNPDPTTTVTAHYHDSTVSSTIVTPVGAGTWTESIFYPEETVTSYAAWTGTQTVTSTTIIPENAEIPATIVIGVPDAITTTTIAWTGDENSSSTIYPADGQNGTITVEILTPRKTETSYVPWTGTQAVTSTTIIPENAEIPATVVIGVPDAITTTTHFWTGTETSSTTIYPVEGKNGTITIEVLTPRDVITSTIFWTGSFISTYTTISQEDSKGDITVGVEIPRSTKTFNDFWSGSTTSYTTEYPSELDKEVIVHEYFPQSVASDGAIYITTYWTGDFTSSSTINPGFNNGTTTILVNIPQQTITETWSGTVVSTSFYCPYNGAASIPVVLIPSSIAFSKSCKDCVSSSVSSSAFPSVGTSSFFYESSISFGSSFTSALSDKFSGSSSSGSIKSSVIGFSQSITSTQDVDIAYSNIGNKLVLLNICFISSLLFTFYFAV